jgi:photosystem II protein PsbQ
VFSCYAPILSVIGAFIQFGKSVWKEGESGIMVNYRSVLAVILALVTALMLNVGSVEAAKKPRKPLTYKAEQIQLIQNYAAELTKMRDRMPELASLIQAKDWTFARNLIHGPFGELRVTMQNVSRNLLPNDQENAKKLEKSLFNDLVAIDLAAQGANSPAANKNFNQAVKDFDAFLNLIPNS